MIGQGKAGKVIVQAIGSKQLQGAKDKSAARGLATAVRRPWEGVKILQTAHVSCPWQLGSLGVAPEL